MFSVSEKGLRERIEHIVKNWMWLRAPKAELEQALAATPAPMQGEKGLRERLDEALWWQENRIAHDYGECREETDGQLCLGCARILELEQALAATPAVREPGPTRLSVQELRGALARGYCHDKNRDKVLDSDLLVAIESEVLALLSSSSAGEAAQIEQLCVDAKVFVEDFSTGKYGNRRNPDLADWREFFQQKLK